MIHEGYGLTSHLVLKNAKCLLAGAVDPLSHEYLRVSLTNVTAWTWGAVAWWLRIPSNGRQYFSATKVNMVSSFIATVC